MPAPTISTVDSLGCMLHENAIIIKKPAVAQIGIDSISTTFDRPMILNYIIMFLPVTTISSFIEENGCNSTGQLASPSEYVNNSSSQ